MSAEGKPGATGGGRSPARALVLATLASLGACAAPPGDAPGADQVPLELARTESAVKLALIESGDVDAASVRVVATGTAVTLGGFVGSEAERESAPEAALEAARAAADGLAVVDELEGRN